MSSKNAASNITAPTQFLKASSERYAYRRFGTGQALPLLCLSTLRERWTIGIRPSPIRLRASGR
jgi:hypothetical protein